MLPEEFYLKLTPRNFKSIKDLTVDNFLGVTKCTLCKFLLKRFPRTEMNDSIRINIPNKFYVGVCRCM